MNKLIFILGSALSLCLAALPAQADEAALARAIIEANAAGTETPRVSVLDPKIDLDGAYRVQQVVVDDMLAGGDSVAGYKAGLTGKLARWWFGIDKPVFGVVPASGLRKTGAVIGQPKGRHMLLETEIAFVAGARIDKPVADIAALKPLMRGVVPVIEAPAGGFPESQARKLTVTDIVANNVSAHLLIVGAEQPVEGLNLTTLPGVLTLDGEVVSKGAGADAMGDPWAAALWLVNVAIGQGRVIEPGHFLSTGVIGKRVESAPGRYLAEFGKLGTIEFTIE
ncbi:MAG: hypothetical protein OEZ03_09405 [Alphaproteobacteria bacterium]|nr:hypothetical protein [Alphaproteobacteria bacterium]